MHRVSALRPSLRNAVVYPQLIVLMRLHLVRGASKVIEDGSECLLKRPSNHWSRIIKIFSQLIRIKLIKRQQNLQRKFCSLMQKFGSFFGYFCSKREKRNNEKTFCSESFCKMKFFSIFIKCLFLKPCANQIKFCKHVSSKTQIHYWVNSSTVNWTFVKSSIRISKEMCW